MWALMHMNEESTCGTFVVGSPETALPDSTLGKLDIQAALTPPARTIAAFLPVEPPPSARR
jgi:hypothetical protein